MELRPATWVTVDLDEESLAALRDLEASGLSRSVAIRRALIHAASHGCRGISGTADAPSARPEARLTRSVRRAS